MYDMAFCRVIISSASFSPQAPNLLDSTHERRCMHPIDTIRIRAGALAAFACANIKLELPLHVKRLINLMTMPVGHTYYVWTGCTVDDISFLWGLLQGNRGGSIELTSNLERVSSTL